MLKIRDDVDLKELEKFGFRKYEYTHLLVLRKKDLKTIFKTGDNSDATKKAELIQEVKKFNGAVYHGYSYTLIPDPKLPVSQNRLRQDQ